MEAVSTEVKPPYLILDRVSKRFGETIAADGVSLELSRGQVLALLGPSGSGKTTTLRLLAGFESPDSGRIVVDGEDVTRVPPAARRFGMVFQHYALFPHLDVGENIAFGLESLGVKGEALRSRIAESLRLVELEGYERRRVGELSGGQQQRVALARALAPEPRVLLLDEPLSNLDPTLRERTRRELRAVIERVGITTVIVTHEQDEAFDLGQIVAVLRAGRVEQVGSPDQLYSQPANPFVAGFVGRSSALEVTVMEQSASHTVIGVADGSWRLPFTAKLPAGAKALLIARPEAMRLDAPGNGSVTGRVVERRFTGANAYYTVQLSDGRSIEVAGSPEAARPDTVVGIEPAERGLHLFPAAER
jgi:putative spermidine/putrescine transport system ATP-binding protein